MFASPLIHREDDLLHEILDCENISRESSLLRFLINKNNYQIKFLYIETYVFRKIILRKKKLISVSIFHSRIRNGTSHSPHLRNSLHINRLQNCSSSFKQRFKPIEKATAAQTHHQVKSFKACTAFCPSLFFFSPNHDYTRACVQIHLMGIKQ